MRLLLSSLFSHGALWGGVIIKYTAIFKIIECIWYLWPAYQYSYFAPLWLLFSEAYGFQMPLLWIVVCRVATMVLKSLYTSHPTWYHIPYSTECCACCLAFQIGSDFLGLNSRRYFPVCHLLVWGKFLSGCRSAVCSPTSLDLILLGLLVGIFFSNGRIICFPLQNNCRVETNNSSLKMIQMTSLVIF